MIQDEKQFGSVRSVPTSKITGVLLIFLFKGKKKQQTNIC